MNALSAFLGETWLAIAVHLWQTSIVLAIVFLLARRLRSAPARVLHRLWSLAFLKIVLPLSILGPLVGRVTGLFRAGFGSSADEVSWQLPATLQALIDPSGTVARGAPSSLDWIGWLLLVLTVAWLAVVGVRVRRLVGDVQRARGREGWPLGEVSSRIRNRISMAIRDTGISRSDLKVVSGGALPHTAGFLRPRILVPQELVDALDDTELRAVLLHEEAHRSRRDPLRRLLQRAVGCLLFFYVPLHAVERRLGEAVELVCDDRVSITGIERETFARALSKTIRFGLAANLSPLSAGVGGGPTLRLRIQRISTPGRFSMLNRHRLLLGLVVLLIAFTTFLPIPLRADEPASAPATASPAGAEKEEAEKEEAPELDKMPSIIQKTLVQPEYPKEERVAGIEGKVVVKVEVTEDGTPGEITPIEEVEDHPAFTASAIAAVQQWRFEPGELDGEPIACEVKIPIQFRLDADKEDEADEPEKTEEP